MEGKSLKAILQGMKLQDGSFPIASAEEALGEIERVIASYRAGQEAQRQAIGE